MRRLLPLTETWRELLLLILAATLVGFTLTITYPLLTLALERAGASPLAIGINSAAGGCGIFLVGPFLHRLVARFGPTRCYRFALCACAACLLLFMLRVDLRYWFAVRLAYGCAAAVLFVLIESAMSALAPEEQRGRVIGLYAALFTVGYAGGPLVLALAGSEGPLPFLLAAAIFLLALLPTLFLRRLDRAMAADRPAARGAVRRAWLAAPLAMACVLVYSFAEGAHFALLPLWGIGRGLTPEAAAALVGIWLSGNIVVQLPLGWLADRGSRPLVIGGCALVAAAALLALRFVDAGSPLLWPALIVGGGCLGGLYSLGLVLVGERFAGPDLPAANTAFVMTFQVGMIAGPPLVGSAMQLFGPGSFTLAVALPLAFFGLLALRAARPAAAGARPGPAALTGQARPR